MSINKFATAAGIVLAMTMAVPAFAAPIFGSPQPVAQNPSEPNDVGGNGSHGATGNNPNPTGPNIHENCVRGLANGDNTTVICPLHGDANIKAHIGGGGLASQVESGDNTSTN